MLKEYESIANLSENTETKQGGLILSNSIHTSLQNPSTNSLFLHR